MYDDFRMWFKILKDSRFVLKEDKANEAFFWKEPFGVLLEYDFYNSTYMRVWYMPKYVPECLYEGARSRKFNANKDMATKQLILRLVEALARPELLPTFVGIKFVEPILDAYFKERK